MDEARRLQYLAAMGIQVWQPKGAANAAAAPEPQVGQHANHSPEPQPRQGLRSEQTANPSAATSAANARAALQAIARASSARKSQAEEKKAQLESPPDVPTTDAQRSPPASQPETLPAAPTPSSPTAGTAPQPSSPAGSEDAQEPPAWLDEAPPWTEDDQPPWAAIEPEPRPITHPQEPAAPAAADDQREITNMDWDALAAHVAECRRCKLCETRTKTVFGVGDRHAELMFIGEGPGQDEDRQGEPFVGRAGQLLNKMLAAVGLAREQVYIANIVKCRPPRNRNPAPEEAAACRAYLERQIALIQPKLIVSLGAVSANNLLGNTDAVGRLRNRQHRYQPGNGGQPIPLIVTYHPSYYLRSPAEKAKGWQDLQRIIEALKG